MIHSVRLTVKKSLGDGRDVNVGTRVWKVQAIERREFVRCVQGLYEAIELPYFPSLARVDLEMQSGIERLEAAEPVDDPAIVALILWMHISELDGDAV